MQRVLVLALFLIPFLWILSGKTAMAEGGMKGPFNSGSPQAKTHFQTSTSNLVLNGMIQFYSKYISPADGPRSPSFPTGSAYGRQAITTYGFIPGVFLIADRLFHESDTHLGHQIMVYGKPRYHDPLEHNTFWWDSDVQK